MQDSRCRIRGRRRVDGTIKPHTTRHFHRAAEDGDKMLSKTSSAQYSAAIRCYLWLNFRRRGRGMTSTCFSASALRSRSDGEITDIR